MYPDIISLGELLVEFIREDLDVPHGEIGRIYKGPFPSGAPAIFIDTVARMGQPFGLSAGFIGVVGNDEFGLCIIEKLQKDNVDTSHIRVTNQLTTGIAFNQYNSDGSRKFIFAQGAAGETAERDINEDYFKNIKNLHIMGSALSISEKSKDACIKALHIAKKTNPNVIISFDPNIRPEMLALKKFLKISMPILESTDILLPSGEEAEILAGVKGFKKSCHQLLEMGPKIIVLKEGKDGCTIFTQSKLNGLKVEGFKIVERDPTGAGDSFGGAFIIGYLSGWDLKKIAIFANAVGALKVESIGPMANNSFEDALRLMNTFKHRKD